MTKSKFLLLIFLFPLVFQAQTSWDEAGIREMLGQYFQLMEDKEMVKTLDHIHPKLFEIAPRAMLEEQIAATFADTTVIVGMHDYEIGSISKLIKEDDVLYGRVDYVFTMDMKFMENEENEENVGKNDFMMEMFKGLYGEENVSYDEETDTIIISITSSLFVIGDPEIGSWKMIENKKGGEALLNMILPEKILEKLH